ELTPKSILSASLKDPACINVFLVKLTRSSHDACLLKQSGTRRFFECIAPPDQIATCMALMQTKQLRGLLTNIFLSSVIIIAIGLRPNGFSTSLHRTIVLAKTGNISIRSLPIPIHWEPMPEIAYARNGYIEAGTLATPESKDKKASSFDRFSASSKIRCTESSVRPEVKNSRWFLPYGCSVGCSQRWKDLSMQNLLTGLQKQQKNYLRTTCVLEPPKPNELTPTVPPFHGVFSVTTFSRPSASPGMYGFGSSK
ncbi:hypothetical protein M514_06405, partial [Trichuris suis]